MADIRETGGNIDTSETQSQDLTDITVEDVERLVGPNLQERIKARLVELGVISQEEPFELENPLGKHIRKGKISGARYPYDKDHGAHGVLVSFINTQKPTLRHQHLHPDGVTDVTEEYYWMGGDATLSVGDIEVKLNEENPFVSVPPGVAHVLRTDSFALTVIIMRNVASLPADQRHLPVGE